MATWNLEGMQQHLLICNGSTCMKQGGEEITVAIRDEIAVCELDDKIHTTRTRCNGRCKDKCVVISYPDGIWYNTPTEEVARAIVHGTVPDAHIVYRYEDDGLERNTASKAIKGLEKPEGKKTAEKQKNEQTGGVVL